MNRRIQQGIGDFIRNLLEIMHRRRTVLISLSCVVVFLTTYMLILPAFTLEKDEALEQGGIDIPAAELTEDTDKDQEEAVEEESEAGEEADLTKPEEPELKAKPEAKEASDTESKQAAKPTDNLLYEGDNFKVSIDDAKSVLPEDASVQVEEIDKNKKEYAKQYKELYKDALTAVQEEKDGKKVSDFSFAKFYDISIVDGKKTIEPDSAVDVKIEFDEELQKELNAENTDRVKIVHFSKDKETGEITPEVLGKNDVEVNTDNKDKLTDTTFKAEGFSVYAVVYTVDFHYEIDGETYEYSFKGGGSVGLRELIDALNVIDGKNVDTDEFIENIENVEFSNEKLVKVVKVNEDTTAGVIKDKLGLSPEYSKELTAAEIAELDAKKYESPDWVLISLKAFDTEETLTITMANGEVFTIKVTDSNFASTVDGKTFALIIANDTKTSGHALDATLRNDARFTSRTTSINYLGETVNEEVYFCEDVDSIKWTFEYVKGSGNQFKLKANNGQYLHYEEGQGFSLSGEPTVLYADVKEGDNDHVRLCIDEGLKNAVNLYGGNNGFGIWGSGNNDPNELFTLCKPFNMNSNTPATINTVDNNAEGIELKLFDYDFIATPGTTGDLDKEGNKVEGKNNNAHYNTSVNLNKKFWFLGWGADSNETTPGINDFTGLSSNIRALQGIVQNRLGSDGYPVLAVDQNGSATNDSLNYLFDGTANDTRSYTANHLFEKIGDKYSYDSNKHYAEFNRNTGNFTVYDGTLEQNSGSDKNWAKNDKAVGFFPFDSYSDMKGLYDNNRLYLNPNVSENDQRKANGQHYRMNHHNGMSLETHFRLPEEGKDSYGNDIEFEFSGDDDLWVYIDDVLVLDIGGVHQPLNGKINFTTGEVTVDKAVAAKGAGSIAGESTTIEEMFRKAGKTYDLNKLHEMKVYWIERGGCDSNCKIEFNLPLTTTKEAGAIEFDKTSAINPSLKLQGAVFTLFTDAACTQPYTIGNVPVTATSGKDGKVHFYAIPVGTYYVKETTFPEGYQAKNPEEIFTVNVAKDVTVKPQKDGSDVDPVTNEPKKTEVEVEKVWSGGDAPDGASVEVTLERYKLVEDPNAQGSGKIVIKDSYTGLPSGHTYHVKYTITGPDNYSETVERVFNDTSKSIEETVLDVPTGGPYIVEKQVSSIQGYSINNSSGTQNATVPKNGSVDAQFAQSTFTRNSYRVRIYAMNQQDMNNLELYSENYYPAESSLSLAISHNAYNWGFFSFTVSSNTGWTSDQYSSDSSQVFTNNLDRDIDLYVRCSNNGWHKGYDWIKDPYITGANPVRMNAPRSKAKAAKAPSAETINKTAEDPTLPDPPKDTLYVKDTEYTGKITLSDGKWTDKLTDLDAYNDYGPYVYYIKEIKETGMPRGTTVSITNEVTKDGAENVLTVTNTVPLGNLKITKNILKNGVADSSVTGTFYYAVYDEPYDAEADPVQTPVRTGSISVTNNGTRTVTEGGLYYGEYYVYELTGEGGTPIVSGNDGTYSSINSVIYKVNGSGSSADVAADDVTVTLSNDRETVSKTATKTWSDNADHPTIYFKLFYEKNNGVDDDGHPIIEDIEVEGAEVKELKTGTTSVTWDDLPRFDATGSEYNYLVKEYIKVGDEYVAAAPEGYVKEELGLTVNNKKSEGYDPKTTYSGTKIWVDTANNGATRPETIHVTLYANGTATDKVAQWTKGTGDKANEWTYTFSDLPVFDGNGLPIQYSALETPVGGYTADDPAVTPTNYTVLDNQTPARITSNSSLDIELAEETDLAYIVIKKNAKKHLVWTQRAITPEEKQRIYRDINELEGFVGELSDSTVEFVNGLPVEKAFQNGSVTITKTSSKVMHVQFVRENQWAQVCYGSYRYDYAPGTTSFTNRLKTISLDATKEWNDASDSIIIPPAGTTAVFDLFINGIEQNKKVELDGTVDKQNDHAYESEAWKAFWDDLPEADKDGNTITYVIRETSCPSGFVNDTPNGVSTGGKITNKRTETEINIVKVSADNNTALTGAKFILELFDETGKEKLYEWPETEVSKEEGKEGSLTFTGLPLGKYRITETQSPDGYVRIEEPVWFDVTSDESGNLSVEFENTQMVTYDRASNTFTVKNEPGAELPHTGGIGTTLFYIFGSVMLLGGAVGFISRRRASR